MNASMQTVRHSATKKSAGERVGLEMVTGRGVSQTRTHTTFPPVCFIVSFKSRTETMWTNKGPSRKGMEGGSKGVDELKVHD